MEPITTVAAGLGIGTVFGLFGAGGSAFATPVLALLGVPGAIAVASPLPAMLPAAAANARRQLRSGNLDRRLALLAVAGGFPGTIAGGLASGLLPGDVLLVLSGLMLLAVGIRMLLPDRGATPERCAARLADGRLVVAAAFVVGLLTGLLANGGGFLLVPLFVVVFGLSAGTAAGTSMVAVGILTIPTLLTHWALGHIDWPLAIVFTAGVIPGSLGGTRLRDRLAGHTVRTAFGLLLVGFAVWFLFQQVR